LKSVACEEFPSSIIFRLFWERPELRPPAFNLNTVRVLIKGCSIKALAFQIGLRYMRGKERMACGPLRVVTV